jgi:signal peptidase I
MESAPSGRIGMVIVRGNSMLPTLQGGNRLLVRYGRQPVPGDLVVARLQDGTVVVKRAREHRADGWWLLSDNPSVGLGDSRAWGAVPADRVLAVVLLRLWPRPGRLARTTPDG